MRAPAVIAAVVAASFTGLALAGDGTAPGEAPEPEVGKADETPRKCAPLTTVYLSEEALTETGVPGLQQIDTALLIGPPLGAGERCRGRAVFIGGSARKPARAVPEWKPAPAASE